MNLFQKIKEREEAAPVTKQSLTKSILVTACVLTVLSFSVTAFVTMAWFSNNKKVDSNDMAVDIEVTSNLIICDDSVDISTLSVTDASFSHTYTTSSRTLKPATHYVTALHSATVASAPASGLVYNSNPSAVSPTSGVARDASAEALGFAAVAENATTSPNYVEYQVRIASAGVAMPVSALSATLNSTTSPLKDYQNAASVDFYIGQVATGGEATRTAAYAGTLNLAGKNRDNSGDALTSFNILSALSPSITSIPKNTDGYLWVIMRFYFDGALEKAANQAYVYSNGLETGGFNLSVRFNAVDPT